MSAIFAGECEFTTPRPFESRSARVKLSFTVDQGENADAVVAAVGTAAREYALAMVNGTSVAPAAEVEAPKTRTRKAPEPTPEPAPVPLERAAPEIDAFNAAGAVAQSAPGSATVSDTALSDPSKSSVQEITNEHLMDAITRKNGDARNTAAIKELIVSFTGNPLDKIYVVTDQAKRADFLTKLAALGT